MKVLHLVALAVLGWAVCGAARAGEAGCDERFASGPETGWTREPDSSAAALAWPAAGGAPGLAFDPALGFGSVWRTVDLGAGGCELSCEVELTRGFAETWRWPGVAVALASAEPAVMGKDDWALVISLHKQGIRLTAVRGGVYQPWIRGDGAVLFVDREVPKRYEVTMGGAGGLDWSVEWPEKRLAGQRLRLWAARLPDGRLRFAASHLYGPGATWWEAQCALPADLAARPLRVLAVRTVRAPGAPDKWTEPLDPKKGPGAAMPAGVLRWVRARPLDAGAKPEPPVFAESDLPSAWTLAPASGEVHPSLYGDAAALEKVRARLQQSRWQAWRGMLLGAAGLGSEEAIRAEKGDRLNTPTQIGDRLSLCAWAWVLTGDPRARDRALGLVGRLTTATDSLPTNEHNWPGRRRQLLELSEFSCHAIEALATTYDLMHAELGEARRRAVLRVLHRGLDYYRERMKANDWWYADNPSNTIGVAAGCHGIGALALLRQRPKEAEEALALAERAIKERYIGIADDGGCREGTLYWQYGGGYPIVFGLALERSTGNGRGLLDLPRFRNAGAYVRVILGGDGEMTCFNDTRPWLNGLAPLALCAGKHGDPLCLWLVDRLAALAASGAMDRNAGEKLLPAGPVVGDQRNAGPALLLRLLRDDAHGSAAFPGVPTLAKLDSIAEGVLRSDGGEWPRLLVAAKGNGAKNTHHANGDQGSITLAARGETLLIDPGYFEQGPDCHSLPVPAGIDLKLLNEKWKATAPAPLSDAWEAGDLRTMTADASAVAKPLGLARQKRVVALLGDRAAVLLDDLAPAEGKLRMQAQLQCGFPVEVGADRRTARVKGRKGDLLATRDAPGRRSVNRAPKKARGKESSTFQVLNHRA